MALSGGKKMLTEIFFLLFTVSHSIDTQVMVGFLNYVLGCMWTSRFCLCSEAKVFVDRWWSIVWGGRAEIDRVSEFPNLSREINQKSDLSEWITFELWAISEAPEHCCHRCMQCRNEERNILRKNVSRLMKLPLSRCQFALDCLHDLNSRST